MKKGWKIALIAGLVVLLILILSIGFTQTKFFRGWLHGYILATVHRNTNAELTLGDFSGSLFTGLTITGVSVILHGEELFTADLVELRYNPIHLFRRRIALSKLKISHPKVNLRRSWDGVWNFQRLPKGLEDTAGPPHFPWDIELKSFEVVRGEFSLFDSTADKGSNLATSPSIRNPYRHVVLSNLGSRMSASLSPERIEISVNRLDFDSPTFKTRLEQLSGKLQYSGGKLLLKNLNLRTTGSALAINGEVEGLDLGKGIAEQLEENPKGQISLDAPQIRLNELEMFIPDSPTLEGSISIKLLVSGRLADFRIEQFELRGPHSEIRVAGRLYKLLDAKSRGFDLELLPSVVALSEIPVILPSVKLPDFTRLKRAELSGYVKGELNNFQAKVVGDFGPVGKLEAEGSLDVRNPSPQYRGKFSTRALNVGAFLNVKLLEGRLNAVGEISGQGITPRNLDLAASLVIDSSEISQIPVERSVISLMVREKRARGDLSIRSVASALKMQGTIDLENQASPEYSLDGEFSSIDLARIFWDKRYRSDLNGTIALNGTGDDLDHVSGSLDLQFGESHFRDYRFHGPGVKLFLDQQRHDKKTVRVESPVFDVHIDGDFHLKPVVSLVEYQVGNILRSLKERLPFADTTRVVSMPRKPAARRFEGQWDVALAKEYLNFEYQVNVKSLTALAVFLGEENFNAKGSATGFVVGNADDLLLGVQASVNNFFYRGKETRIYIADGEAYLEADHLKLENVLDALEEKIDVSASTFIFQGLQINNLRASVDYLRGQGSFDVRGLIDSALIVETNGVVRVVPEGYVWSLDNLTLDYKGYVWTNSSPVVTTIDTSGLMMRSVEMTHREERLVLNGGIRSSRELDLTIQLKDFQLSNLHYFFHEEQKRLSGSLSVDATVSGSHSDPSFGIRATSSDIGYEAVTFGTFLGEVNYQHRRAGIRIELTSSAASEKKGPDLLVTGSLPIHLALGHVEDRFPDEPLDLRMQANAFRLGLLDPFIPVFHDVDGRFFADLRVGGTMKKPSGAGSMKLEEGKFMFAPNQITYYISGTFEPKADKILITELAIQNGPGEQAEKLSVTGELAMRELSIDSFDLTAKGELLILRETARKSTTSIYGNLFVRTGANSLRYYGNFDRSWVTGTILVQTMSITFPPVTLLPTVKPTSAFSYTVVDDTSKPAVYSADELLTPEVFLRDQAEGRSEQVQRSRMNTFERLLAGMRAEVAIETDGPALLRMIFAYSTGEELFSELRGKLFLIKDDFGTRFSGDLDVGLRSYYYFYKRFDATGELKFSGALDNPELDITATYEGYRIRPRTDTLLVSSSASREQRIVVTLKITGPRITPKLTIEMTVDGMDWPGDVQSDAIAFIVSGKFRDDLTTSERNQIATGLGTSFTSTFITGVTSSLLSGVLTDFLRREFGPFIRQAELSYSGGSLSETADLRVTGEIGKTIIRVGGRVFNDIGNANVSVQMPVGRIIGSPALEDLIIELERKVEGSNYATDEKRLTNFARIYYRITF